MFIVDGSLSPKGGPWGLLDYWGRTSDRWPDGCSLYLLRHGVWKRAAGGVLTTAGHFEAWSTWRAADHNLKARIYLPAYGLYGAAWSTTFTIKR